MGATMKNKFVRLTAALAIAAGAALAVPTAANAYPDPPTAEVSGLVVPGGVVTLTSPADYFVGNEAVGITITGESANGITLGMLKMAIETNSSLRAQAVDGDLSVNLRFPTSAAGTYDVTFVGLESGRTLTGTVTTAAAGGGSNAGGSGLPATGLDSGSLLGLWVGGGALVLAGGAIAVGTTVRRHRNNAAA